MTQSVRKAIILAAGRGTRLGELTANRPKPMIPVAGKPVLEWIVEALRATGIYEFLMVVGYRGQAIRQHFGDGAAFGVRVIYVEQQIPNGTGAALVLGREFAGGGPVLSAFGDILTDPLHYASIVSDFDRSTCAAILGINALDDPTAGAAVYREADRVIRVEEKPPPGTAGSNWNLAGVNVFSPDIFDSLACIQPSPRGEYELTAAIAALIVNDYEVRACEFHGFWSDVGSVDALAKAHSLMTQELHRRS